jgi:hypothetical protein
VVGFLGWLSGTGFDFKAHTVWPYVWLASAIALGTQIEIRRAAGSGFSLRFWLCLGGLILLAVLPIHLLVTAVQPWSGMHSVAVGVVEAVAFGIALDWAAPGRGRGAPRSRRG